MSFSSVAGNDRSLPSATPVAPITLTFVFVCCDLCPHRNLLQAVQNCQPGSKRYPPHGPLGAARLMPFSIRTGPGFVMLINCYRVEAQHSSSTKTVWPCFPLIHVFVNAMAPWPSQPCQRLNARQSTLELLSPYINKAHPTRTADRQAHLAMHTTAAQEQPQLAPRHHRCCCLISHKLC